MLSFKHIRFNQKMTSLNWQNCQPVYYANNKLKFKQSEWNLGNSYWLKCVHYYIIENINILIKPIKSRAWVIVPVGCLRRLMIKKTRFMHGYPQVEENELSIAKFSDLFIMLVVENYSTKCCWYRHWTWAFREWRIIFSHSGLANSTLEHFLLTLYFHDSESKTCLRHITTWFLSHPASGLKNSSCLWKPWEKTTKARVLRKERQRSRKYDSPWRCFVVCIRYLFCKTQS